MAIVGDIEVDKSSEQTGEVEAEKAAEQTEAKSDAHVESGDTNGDEEQKSEAPEVEELAATASEPPAPAMPEFKLSQILPMVAMFGLQKFNLEEMGYVRHVEVGYIAVQVVCFLVLYLTYVRIGKMADDGHKISIPEVKQMGQVVTPATQQTAKEYDMAKLKEAVKQPLMGFLILGGIYYKWRSLMPLVMQVLMTPMKIYEDPLTQIHLMGKEMQRPFPAPPGMFGMPSAPAPEAAGDAVADKKDK